MRSPRLVRAALLAVPVALVALPGAAAGSSSGLPADCTPVDITNEAALDQRAAAADDVFVGRVEAAAPVTGSGRVGYGVSVQRVWLGDVAQGQQAAVTVDWPVGAQPGVAQGTSYLFFTDDTVDGMVADPCDGTVPLPKGLTPKLAAMLEQYLATVEPPPLPIPTPAPVTFHQPTDPLGEPPEIGRVLASGGAISLIGVLGLLLVSRLGRRR
ncbi:hypothetical protein [Nocardioides daeguensis]|uniref:Uncharacterized protein n=1 Tax=Nocardioides daeguensis TaxID=908359 RepID=A0ABP6WJK5_9ACTN|nr:hypothetical protein [Nocardioides daeguensis]MBV6727881.1 hypothetical protein [Nocardioides daeguensis]MCR1775359.1 hypothetical protein [Nocardioides daeguensis]